MRRGTNIGCAVFGGFAGPEPGSAGACAGTGRVCSSYANP